ncbi:MAG: hypothetical protein JWO68_2123 [Actinomycetia bacterium]|nr:hypothetical protein [Actinomycetes bacterium]
MELRPFGTLTLDLASDRLFFLGETPVGKRIIQEIESVQFTGAHFNARSKGKASADWLSIDGAGIATFDIRMLLETEDEALVYLAYEGKADWSKGMATEPVYVTAHFETGDDRYRWLNHALVVGKGELVEGGGLAYQFQQVV